MRRFWFLRDAEGTFCWQICVELPATKYTYAIHAGIGFDQLSSRVYFITMDETRGGIAMFHWNLGGTWSGGMRFPTFSRWTDETGRRAKKFNQKGYAT